MKKTMFNKKLVLNKRNIADLTAGQMKDLKGGSDAVTPCAAFRATFTCDYICEFTDGCVIYESLEHVCYMMSAPPLKTQCEICIP